MTKKFGRSRCILHRPALLIKMMSNSLKFVLDKTVNIVKFIKARPINSRMFKLLCMEVGSEYGTLIVYAKVRWLSRGKLMIPEFQLRMNLQCFFV
jgi:hypothetical protein